MLRRYDHLEVLLQEYQSHQSSFESKLNFFAGDILKELEIEEAEEISSSLERAFRACTVLNIPFENNFKRVYRFNGKNLHADWKISSLACYLLIINCNPSHEPVARAQLFFALNREARTS